MEFIREEPAATEPLVGNDGVEPENELSCEFYEEVGNQEYE